MEWSKVKNIMLLMLVVTNLILLIFVVVPLSQAEKDESDGRQSAISLLASRGITVDDRTVPDSINLSPQTITLSRDDEATLAANLLGENPTIQDLGGNVLQYSSSLGIVRFHSSGELTAQFEIGAHPLGDSSSQLHGSTIIESLNMTASLTAITRDDEGFTLIYSQLWDGVLLPQYGISLYYQNDSLYQISDAQRLSGTAVVDESTSFSVATALMQFLTQIHELGDICRTITEITPAYGASTSLSGTVQLSPLWLITTDTGSYQLDLLSGVLSRT